MLITIGMHIARKMATLMKGNITCESTVGRTSISLALQFTAEASHEQQEIIALRILYAEVSFVTCFI